MTEKTAEEIYGYEYDWLACDMSGYIALLSTAGGGCAPRALLADTDVYDRVIEAILNLPATSLVKDAPQVSEGLPNTWEQVVKRGLYAFDSDALGGPYRLVGVPHSPAHVDEFTKEIMIVATRIKLRTVEFNLVAEISEMDITNNE